MKSGCTAGTPLLPGTLAAPGRPADVYTILGVTVAFVCAAGSLQEILQANCAAHPAGNEPASLCYTITQGRDPLSFTLARAGREALGGQTGHDLLFAVEQDLTVELQHRRPELLFLHAAALEWQDEVHLVVGASGSGKSTTAWALVHHGFRYLSDELAPIDVATMNVLPYPRALCLKRDPGTFPLPADALELGSTIYVPAHSLPAPVIRETRPLANVFVLGTGYAAGEPRLRPLGRAEAAARLYPHALNALAHPHLGLDAIARIVENVPCTAVDAGALLPTCVALRTHIERGAQRASAVRLTASPVRGIDRYDV